MLFKLKMLYNSKEHEYNSIKLRNIQTKIVSSAVAIHPLSKGRGDPFFWGKISMHNKKTGSVMEPEIICIKLTYNKAGCCLFHRPYLTDMFTVFLLNL